MAGRAGAAAGAGAGVGAGAAAGGGAGVGTGGGAALAAGAGLGGSAAGAGVGGGGGAADNVDDGADEAAGGGGGGVSCGGGDGASCVGAGDDGAAATLGGVRVAGGGGGGGVSCGGGGEPVSTAEGARGGVGGLSVKTGGSAGGVNAGAELCATADGADDAEPRVEDCRDAVRGCPLRDWLFDVPTRGGWVSAGAASDDGDGAFDATAERPGARWRADGAVSDARRAGAGPEPRSSSTLQSTSTLVWDCRSCSWAIALGATALPAQAITARLIAQATPRMRAIPVCASTRIIRAVPWKKH